MYGKANSNVRKNKIKELAFLCKQYPFISITECHGGTVELEQTLNRFISSHYLFHSPVLRNGVPHPGSGGVAILIRRELLTGYSSFDPTESKININKKHFEIIVPGRVVKTSLFGFLADSKCLCIYSVHNEGLSNEQMTHVESCMKRDLHLSQIHPESHCSVLIGDFNLPPRGSVPFSVQNPIPPNRNVAPRAISSTRPFQSRWEKLLDLHTEIHFPQNTHYCSSSCTQNKLDRIFTSAPRSLQTLLKHNAGTIKDSIYWYSKGYSDHAPIFWSISIPDFNATSQRFKIKKEWIMHPHYNQRMSAFANLINESEISIAEHRDILILDS